MSTCGCEHNGVHLVSACGLHAEWLRDNLDKQRETLTNKTVTLTDSERANLVRLLHQRYVDVADTLARKAAYEIESLMAKEPQKEAREALASRLIEAWVADKRKQIPWAKAIEIVSVVTKQTDAERDRLLHLGDEDGTCGMCGRSDSLDLLVPDEPKELTCGWGEHEHLRVIMIDYVRALRRLLDSSFRLLKKKGKSMPE